MVTKKKVIPIIATTCGQCLYCVTPPKETKDDNHYCFFNPPTIIVVEGQVFSARPEIDLDNPICSHFKGKH